MKTYLANIRKILIGCCALLIIAIAVFCVFGFNLGQDFNGYIEIKTSIGQYSTLEDNYEKTKTEVIVGVLEEKGAKVLNTTTEGSYFTTTLVVSVQKISDDRNENLNYAKELKTTLENRLNDELYVVDATLVTGIMTDINLVKVVYTLLITLIVLTIYMLFRIKLLNVICVMASSFSSICILLTLTVLTRVQVNVNFIGIVVLTFVIALIMAFMKFASLVNSKKIDNKFESITVEELGEITLTDAKTIAFALIVLASIIMLIFGSFTMKNYALTVMFSVIALWLTDNFVTLPLCYYFGKGAKKVSANKEVKRIEAKTKEVNNEENN